MSYSSQKIEFRRRSRTAVDAFVIVLILAIAATPSAIAQTFTVIHAFTGNLDGGQPFTGLTLDQRGNLYGTTLSGYFGYGMVFEMKQVNGAWLFNTLHTFRGGPKDGAGPAAEVTIGPNGSVYLFTYGGGDNPSCPGGCGTVYNVRPPATACKTVVCDWDLGVIYAFQGGTDGDGPGGSPLFDPAGNLYGTVGGGLNNDGAIFKLTYADDEWTESIAYNFGGAEGNGPVGLSWDMKGNLYGATVAGGTFNRGTVYRLAPSGGGWQEDTLYSFQDKNDGENPGAVLLDPSGDIYGAAAAGASGWGTIWELTPSGGNWTFSVLYPYASSGPLTRDSAGNLYGVTWAGGAYKIGSVFKLAPSSGGWIYTELYDFQDKDDGGLPTGRVVIDGKGNLYGTASTGGANGWGTVWEITP